MKIILEGTGRIYPASIRIEEPPPHTVSPDRVHASTSIEKDSKHAFPQVNNLLILLGASRIRRIVGHGVLLGNWWNYQRRVKSCQCFTKRCKFGISTANLQILDLS